MNPERLRAILEEVASGKLSAEEALDKVRAMPFEDLGFARVDTHRGIRCGFPEVILCRGKTPGQVAEIAKVLFEQCGRVLATRASEEVRAALREAFGGEELEENAPAGAVRIGPPAERRPAGEVLVLSAGTGDIPVAEEAAFTARALGSPVKTLYDVGVAGIHRLFEAREAIQGANVVIVVAGMEGALASVVGGLVDRPVIAVPTSVGYGAGFGGLSALLAMLNSCAPTVCVMNIDNGFGAGYVAALVNESRPALEGEKRPAREGGM